MYKIVHNFVEIHAEHLLIPADSRTRGIYVTPEEADGTIGVGCDVTDVICPAQVIANGYT
jgi:hypothetical protein